MVGLHRLFILCPYPLRFSVPDPPSPLSNLTNLVQDLNLNSTHWNPSFCGDWRWGDYICVRIYRDRTSKNPLEPTAIEPVLNGAISSLASEPTAAPFTDQTWSANDPTGLPGFVLRIAEWEKKHGLLLNWQVILALGALERYCIGPPYEQSDFLIYHDGAGIIGGGNGRRPRPKPESSMPEPVFIDKHFRVILLHW